MPSGRVRHPARFMPVAAPSPRLPVPAPFRLARQTVRCASGRSPPRGDFEASTARRSWPRRRPRRARRPSACTWPTACSPRGRSAASSWSRRPRTSAASGRPTRRATASTSSPTGPTPRARSRATATASASPTRPSRPGPKVHRAPRGAGPDAADRRRAAPHGRAGRLGADRGARVRRRAGASCCSRARRSARTTRRSRGSPTTTTASRRPDYAYSYTQALQDRVCRPVTFCTYDGDMEWMSDGRRRHADFSVLLPAAESARRLRTALDPDGDWMAEVLRDADRKLGDLRAGEQPDAGGLVIAADKEHADRLADRLARLTGEKPPDRHLRRPEGLGADRRVRRVARAVAGLRADGLRGRRHPAPARRRLRDARAHGAVLPPGRRALHPPHARAAASR